MTLKAGQNIGSVGFTGTHRGMTLEQEDCLRVDLRALYSKGFCEFHHGDCVGADKMAHSIAREIGYIVVIHPPINAKARANCNGDILWPPKPYLKRNHDIVDSCQILLATPFTKEEVLRSGTWATIRYARKIGVKVTIL